MYEKDKTRNILATALNKHALCATVLKQAPHENNVTNSNIRHINAVFKKKKLPKYK